MRLIDADALKEKIDSMWNGRPLSVLGARILVTIDEAPTIEPKHGEWIDNGDRYFRCSLCGTKDTDKWHWCHGCGADMRI